MGWLRFVLPALVIVPALPAQANVFCCNDENGRRICGDILPPKCMDRSYQEYGTQGTLTKQHQAPLTPEQRAQRDADLARKKEQERHLAEQTRQDRALLESYASVRDIELKRDRMVGDLQAALRLAEERLSEAQARQQKLQEQLKGFGARPVPEPLKAQLAKGESDMSGQQAIIDAKKQDIAAVQQRFEQDRQRYLTLTDKLGGNVGPVPKPATPTPPASSSTNR